MSSASLLIDQSLDGISRFCLWSSFSAQFASTTRGMWTSVVTVRHFCRRFLVPHLPKVSASVWNDRSNLVCIWRRWNHVWTFELPPFLEGMLRDRRILLLQWPLPYFSSLFDDALLNAVTKNWIRSLDSFVYEVRSTVIHYWFCPFKCILFFFGVFFYFWGLRPI